MRRRIALCLFVILAVASIDPILVALPFTNLKKLQRFLTEVRPDREWYPEYPAFLEGVREHTQPGDTIALIVPGMKWDYGYSYAYYRASYFLTGREVLPLVRSDDAQLRQNYGRAKYVAAWQTKVADTKRRVAWAGHHGVLLER